MKTIIVATDYSQDANNAMEYAAALAKKITAKVVLFNSFQLPIHAANTLLPVEGYDKILKDNEFKLQNIAENLMWNYDIHVIPHAQLNFFDDELDILVDKYKADLVVMGMKSNSLEYKFFGNTTTSIIKKAKYPVLVVPENYHFKDIDKIIFACDYQKNLENENLDVLKHIAKTFNSHIQILHIGKPTKVKVPVYDQEFEQKIVPFLDYSFFGIYHTFKDIEEEDVVTGIDKGVNEFSADLLVMLPHKHGFWDSLLNKSVTRKIALKGAVPLLAIPG
jgi:nucleotide-binding universal stress UspA family protein